MFASRFFNTLDEKFVTNHYFLCAVDRMVILIIGALCQSRAGALAAGGHGGK